MLLFNRIILKAFSRDVSRSNCSKRELSRDLSVSRKSLRRDVPRGLLHHILSLLPLPNSRQIVPLGIRLSFSINIIHVLLHVGTKGVKAHFAFLSISFLILRALWIFTVEIYCWNFIHFSNYYVMVMKLCVRALCLNFDGLKSHTLL